MNRRFLIAALVLCAIGCKPEKEDDLSPEQVSQIRNDVTAATDTIVARFNRLDVEGTFAVYHESPDFVVLGPDGSKVDYAAYKKMNADFVAPAASVMLTTKANDCRVMASSSKLADSCMIRFNVHQALAGQIFKIIAPKRIKKAYFLQILKLHNKLVLENMLKFYPGLHYLYNYSDRLH